MSNKQEKPKVRADEIDKGDTVFPVRHVRPYGEAEQGLGYILLTKLELEECVKNETK